MKIKIFTFFVLTIVATFTIFYLNIFSSTTLKITFLDVGQGDAIFIRTPSNKKILIDTGRDGSSLSKLGKELYFFEHELDVVVATHDDLDHIGGLSHIIDRYEVHNLFHSLPVSDSKLNNFVLDKALEKDINIVHVDSPKILDFEDGVVVDFLFPTKDMTGGDSNEASVVTRVIFGDTSFLLTGDLPSSGELYLKNIYGKKLKSDVLKLGHHGSDTSSHIEFLKIVDPKVAVVSAGKNNTYGHPHASVVNLLKMLEIETVSTQDKKINFKSDGSNIWLE